MMSCHVHTMRLCSGMVVLSTLAWVSTAMDATAEHGDMRMTFIAARPAVIFCSIESAREHLSARITHCSDFPAVRT
ncbi:hypothetical protein BDV40DRAFT_270678 [Aspergillus tamarii]|uniref:Secreted protein n=1 Tax=Aspergillus tamarii TaxID=41984 RepID=A0A5N6UP36_ASPTM|nr:hypothetical protein BDV40DRAFT_270678 [Aspergillus tamarii]